MRYRTLGLLLLLLFGPLTLPAQTPPTGFTSTLVSGQWNEPVGLTFTASGSHMFVWERPGKVWVVQNGQRQQLLDISAEVGGWSDHGLLGFALHPQFETNGYFYLFYAVDRHYLLNFGRPTYNPATNEYFNASIARLTRYTATRSGGSYSVSAGSRTILLGATASTGVPITSGTHSTGTLLFGTDGTLLVSTGDGAMGGELDWGSNANSYYQQALSDGILSSRENIGAFRAQLLSALNGKILRIDPLTGAGVPSNPFYSAATPDAPRSKVWALGLRNPFRMCLRPGTGSPNPADANPGTIYLGDVGFSTWEEVDVVSRPGQNLGWPLYEGLTPHTPFINQPTPNPDALNPLYGVNGCTQQFFNFQDLLRQATPTGTATFANPCNGTQTIPPSVPTFVHTRPLIDWHHVAGPSRTGTFSGNTATTANLGAAGSPVTGPQFGGSAAVGGVFYPYDDFPANFQNTYFFGDYSAGWMRTLTVDAANRPSAVQDFINSGAVVVHMAVSPVERGIYYVNFYPGEIRRLTYAPSNNPPVAVATASRTYGPGPLSVQFTGSASSDPDGQALTYRWEFADGSTSTEPNPTHTFTPATAAPTSYVVKLTVQDPLGTTHSATLVISVNNTPPQVVITSPAAGTRYSVASQTTFNLRAAVTDTEHGAGQLTYAWQTFLHHESHYHPDPVDTLRQTTTTLEPLGCGAETYFYRVVLTVTDAAGLATTQEIRLDPECSNLPTYSFYRAVNLGGAALTLDGNAWAAQAGAVNFSTNGTPFSNGNVVLTPATDATRTNLIRSAVYRPGSLTATFAAVPAGSYRAYVYVWEDNNPEVFSLTLNGQSVLNNYNSGPAGTWARLGPYPVTLTTTSPIQLVSSGGTANFSGVELWQATGTPPPPPTNQLPTANAGPDQILTLPTSSATLQGAGTDPDGTISSYAWSQVSGPSTAVFSSATASAPTVSGLVAGSYVFSLVVRDNAGASSPPDQVTVTVNPAGGSTYSFYRAVNLGGAALTLEGNAWSGTPATGFTTNGIFFANATVPLLPATDAARTGMLRSAAYHPTSLSATLSGLPTGQYRVWAYVWEDNNPEVFSVALNGQTVQANYNSGPAGTWQKLGPFDVSVTTGILQLTTSGGTCNLSGLEVWQLTGTPPPTNQPPTANAGPDQTLTLPATATALAGSGTDPDGTISSYAWSQSSGPNTAVFSSATAAAPTVSGLVAGTYVFSLVVQDNAGASSPADQVTITVNPQSPPPPTGTYTFYRAVNLGGAALTLEGNAWSGTPATGFTTNGTFFSNGNVALLPATDAARTGMIRSSAYSLTSLSATMSNMPAGTYRVWAYVWEDNNAETFSLALNGQTVQANYNSGPAGTWQKLGPFDVSVTTGQLQLTTSGGTCNLSGLEVWQASGTPPPPTNQLPTANAGPDQTITLPTSSATLQGAGTDPDGTIGSYTWSQNSGPNTAVFSSATAAAPTVSGLVVGSYVFSLVVRDNAGASSPPDQVTVTVNPAGGSTYSFYRAVNLGGGALTLEGNAWSGTPATGFTTNGIFFANATVPLLPATDAARTGMLRSAAYHPTSLSATLSGLPAGTYRVWAYVWEDNNAEVFSVALNGQTVQANYNSGPAGTWQKLGPFDVSVTTGQLQLTTSGGTCNLSGLEVWQASGAARPLAASTAAPLAPASAIYPNPSPDGRYTLTFPPTQHTTLTYALVSPLGRVLARGQLRVPAGGTQAELDLAALPLSTGIYYVQLVGARATPINYKLLR